MNWMVLLWGMSGFPAMPHINRLTYLDPGSGSFILQILLAALLSSLFVFKSFWQKVLSFFRSLGKKKDPGSDQKE